MKTSKILLLINFVRDCKEERKLSNDTNKEKPKWLKFEEKDDDFKELLGDSPKVKPEKKEWLKKIENESD